MSRVSKFFKAMTLLVFISLPLAAPPSGQAGEDSGGGPACVTVYARTFEIIRGGLSISGLPDFLSGGGPKFVTEPFSLKIPPEELPTSHYAIQGPAVFNGPVRVDSGLGIGLSVNDAAASHGYAVFNGPVQIEGGLAVGGHGCGVFSASVDLDEGDMSLDDGVYGRSSMVFHGPVKVKDGDIHLGGRNYAVFHREVRLESGGLIMDWSDDRASVTLAGQAWVTARELKVLGGNRLVFSLSSARRPGGFIQADAVEIDADCLVIDNPADVLEEGAEVVLITGRKIKVNGGNRRIITKQEDEFELLVGENQISARLIMPASMVWYKNLQFDF